MNRFEKTCLAGAVAISLGLGASAAHADALSTPAMTPPLSANPNPTSVEIAGSKIYLTGQLTGVGLWQNNFLADWAASLRSAAQTGGAIAGSTTSSRPLIASSRPISPPLILAWRARARPEKPLRGPYGRREAASPPSARP